MVTMAFYSDEIVFMLLIGQNCIHAANRSWVRAPTPLLKAVIHSLSRLHLKAHTTLVSYCLITKRTSSTMHLHMPTHECTCIHSYMYGLITCHISAIQ
uniref:Uncharacterized protein n=1 Tax=Arundo donax TaxID=35708 RepID=A0A0A8Z042_ARUDO